MWPALSSSGQIESVVRQLASCKMQEGDSADQEARKVKELNAVLRNITQADDVTAESLTNEVNVLFANTMATAVEAANVKRCTKPGNGAAPGSLGAVQNQGGQGSSVQVQKQVGRQ